MRFKSFLLAAAAVVATSVAAHADDTFMVRVRALGVMPEPSGTVYLNGAPLAGNVHITDSVIPEVDFTYFFTQNISAELIAGTTKHSVHQSAVGDIGSVWLLPPTLTAQYHFNPGQTFQPYVGAGLNYTFFYTPHSPLPGIHYRDNVGAAFQAGMDIKLNDSGYYFNIDVKQILLSTHVTALAGAVTSKGVDINPLLVGVGVGYRF